jgi:hypothetical protein
MRYNPPPPDSTETGFRPVLEWLEDRSVPAVLVVTSAADPAGPLVAGTLRYAVDQANQDALVSQSDTITFDTIQMGTSTVTLQQGPLFLAGSGPFFRPGVELIDGGGSVSISGNAQGVVFGVGGGTRAVLSGLTIENGLGPDFGGGIDNGGTLMLYNCTLAGNVAQLAGGGIENFGTLTVNNCTLSGNSSGDGGGISNEGTVTVSNSTLSGNFSGRGGGILNAGTLTVSNSALSGNGAYEVGGGIYNTGTLTVDSATVSANYSVEGGGIDNEGTLTVSNSTLSGNSASFVGSGIENIGTLTVSNSTLSGNSAGKLGGGIISSFLMLETTLESTIVAGDTALFGPDIYGGLTAASAYNLVGDGSGLSGISDNDANHNIVGHPALLAPLGNYGGPTQTMALLPGSPAIGNGPPAQVLGSATDQRGFPRPTAVFELHTHIDIGAFETQNTSVAVSPATASFSANPQAVTLTATVTDNGQPMPLAAGAVTFTVLVPGGTNLTTGPVTIDSQGVATTQLTLPAGFRAGNYTLNASYSDSSGLFSPSSGTGAVSVQPAAPTVSVADINLTYSPTHKQDVTLTASVAAGGVAVAEGTVTFLVSAPSATPGTPPVVLGQVHALVNAQGVATATLPVAAGSPGGTYTIATAFVDTPGGGNYAPAGGSGTLTINPAATTITLHPLPVLVSNATKPQTIALAVNVQSPAGTVPTGMVTFTIDGQVLSAAVGAHGRASVLVTIPAGTPPGSYAVTATYADQANAIGGVNFASGATTGTLILRPRKAGPSLGVGQ